jgi:hypothetical protein
LNCMIARVDCSNHISAMAAAAADKLTSHDLGRQ